LGYKENKCVAATPLNYVNYIYIFVEMFMYRINAGYVQRASHMLVSGV